MDADLSRVCLVDNSPVSYAINQGELHDLFRSDAHNERRLTFRLVPSPRSSALPCSTSAFLLSRFPTLSANGIPIEGWINDPADECLLDLLPMLDSLRFTSDVRRVLGLRGFRGESLGAGARREKVKMEKEKGAA